MDVWSWICELTNSDERTELNSPLVLSLASSDATHSIQLNAGRNLEANSEVSVIFTVCYEQKALWVSDACPLSSQKPFLPLVLQLLQEVVSRSPKSHDATCPRSQLPKLKPDPVSWILDSHSPESFSTFFNLIFLMRLFWLCVCDAPSEVGSLYLYSLLAPNLDTFSCKNAPVFKNFFIAVGTDVELCLIRTFGYMLAKWLIVNEVGAGLKSVTSFSKFDELGFSYGAESHGLWILKGYAPTKAMRCTRFNGQKNQYLMGAKESVLTYALAHQQLEAVIQFDYSVKFYEAYIQVNARVDNIRLHVAKLQLSKVEDDNNDVYADERYFPSRVRVWVGPEVGANYVGGLRLGRSTDNIERETEALKIMKSNFGKSEVPKVKAAAKMATRTKTRNWRWDQDAEGNAATFEAVLCDNTTGIEVASLQPPLVGGGGGSSIANGFRRRYTGANRPFTKTGGVVFAGEECGEGASWRVSREMEGSVLKWRIGCQVWLSYWPNDVQSSYFETRRVNWCDEVDLPLIPSHH